MRHTVATAIRTVCVLLMSFIMVLITDGLSGISGITARTWIFLILSGLATGASWLCYFYALQNGDINKVVPIDKLSTVLSVIFAWIFLNEKVTLIRILCLILIAVGTYMMIDRKAETDKHKKHGWLTAALFSAVFAALTSILSKIGMAEIKSNTGTMLRTFVVLIMAWSTVFITGKADKIRKTPKNELLFIALSGIATGASWLCYYKALKDGQTAVVVPIDKLSILVTVLFSYFVFHEKLNRKSASGLVLLTAGTLGMLL